MAQKRSHDEFAADVASKDDLAVKLSSTTDSHDKHDELEWQVVDTKAKKRKKLPRKEGDRYPSITHSPHARLQSLLGLGVLQNLVLYLLADGPGPQWCSIKNHANFRKVVVLMIPGLEMGMFDGGIDLTATAKALATELVEQKTDTALKQKGYTLPDDYYPKQLDKLDLPASLAPLQDIFDHVWPVKTAGDDRHGKMHSPLSSILTVPVKNDKDDKQNKKGPGPPAAAKHWQNQTTHITTLIATTQELLEAGYVLHPAHFAGDDEAMKGYQQHRLRRHVTQADGWKDSRGTITLDDGPKDTLQPADAVLAVDCEMCITSPPDVEPAVYSLTRVSVIDWDGHVVFDELVKPKDPITNYVTAYSGITAEMLQDVTTTLEDVQEKLLAKLSSQTILVGHSLDSDLNALKITHPFIVDTALLYPHPRGPPLRSSLKWLAQKYLNRSIQAGHGSAGHNSIEDALATLDLVIQKCQKGKAWGTSDASTESIFHRLGRALRPKRFKNQPDGDDEPRTGAVVDWGDPRRGFGSQAKTIVACQNDADVAKGVAAAVNGGAIDSQIPTEGVDFTWARFKELEAYRQWWRNTKSHDMTELRELAISKNADKTLQDVVAETVANIGEIWQSLPPCTAFIVYSGSGDPRRLYELQEQKQQHKAEYATKKWDELTVHWTDKDEQELKRACDIARRGIAFIGVK